MNFYQSENYTDKYCVIYNFWQASEPYLSGDFITLVLHSTPGYISYLEEQVCFLCRPNNIAFETLTYTNLGSNLGWHNFNSIFCAYSSSVI